MSDLRKEFEALPEISKRLDSLELNDLIFINGAWMAFQEKQKQIDVVSSKINELISNYSMRIDPFDQDVNIANNEFIDDLKELLK